MRRRNDGVISGTNLRSGGLAALLAIGIAGCNSESDEAQSIRAPLAAGITDQTFRAAAGCPDCTVTRRSTVSLPLTGKVFTQVKLASASAPGPFAAALDHKGNVVEAQALLAAEGAAKMARQGKLRDDAYARSLTSSSELVRISIWADFGDQHVSREQLLADPTLRAAEQAQTKSRLNTATSKVVRWLDAHGFRTHERGIDTPLITADVPTNVLTELGHLDGVAIVNLKQPEVLAGTTWFNTVKGPAAQAIVGSVAGGMGYCNGEGWQPDDYTFTPMTPSQLFDSTAPQYWHTRWTSELISATASSRMAPGATLYVAGWNGSTTNLYSAWSWCFGLGINNMNRSSGIGYGSLGPQPDDMAEDYYVYHSPYPLITLSAGNCETSTGALIPCNYPQNVMSTYVGNRSYNTLIVGASNGQTTPQTSDDSLATFSQYTNPITTNGDHELPNLVAPGDETVGYTVDGIDSASTGGRGTSASAPIVLGTVLLMKTMDSSITSWPEMIRAMLMAASTHPVDGSRTVRTDPGADLTQGAGLLNADVAIALADPSIRVWGPNNTGAAAGRDARTVYFSTDFPNGRFGPYNITPTINGRLRVVIAWDATAQNCNADGSGCVGVALDGDLDLYVSKWNGSSYVPVCWSTSYDSSWELCDLAVLAGSQYKVEVQKNSTTSSSTYLGIAWNNYDTNAE